MSHRILGFTSLWWSIQESETWPRFTGDLRQRLLAELPLPEPTGDQIDLYFAFRERFLALKTAFSISTWELEHFLLWQKQQEQEKEKASASHALQKSKTHPSNDASRRLSLQWLLAKMGRKVGCEVWIARQDHKKTWQEELFGHLSIPALPAQDSRDDEAHLENIAVLWLLKDGTVAAYEIASNEEAIVTSFLHLYDLGLTRSKRRTRLCLIIPEHQFAYAQQLFARPVFRQQQERYHCALISAETLTQHGEHILWWATSSAVIEDIIAFSMV